MGDFTVANMNPQMAYLIKNAVKMKDVSFLILQEQYKIQGYIFYANGFKIYNIFFFILICILIGNRLIN